MPRPYPREVRDDVVRVARNRDHDVTLEQVASDVVIHPLTLSTWLLTADVEAGVKPGVTGGLVAGVAARKALAARE